HSFQGAGPVNGNPTFDITGQAPGSTLTAAQIAANLAIANSFFTTFGTQGPLILPDGTVLPGTTLLNDVFPGWATGFAVAPGGLITDYAPNFVAGPNTTTTGDLASQVTTASEVAPSLEPTQIPPPLPTAIPEIDPGALAGALTLLGGGLLLLTERRLR